MLLLPHERTLCIDDLNRAVKEHTIEVIKIQVSF